MSADTEEDLAVNIEALKKLGITLSNKADEVILKSKHLGMCKSIAEVAGEWDYTLIEKRSERIAELAWDKLYPWLES